MKRLIKSKRHFLLLELMIAFFLLLICIAPTMRIFTKMYVSQQEMTRENQRDHMAHLVHAHLVEQMYKGHITLREGMDAPIPLENRELNELMQKYAYGVQGTLKVIDRHPKEKDPAKKYLVEIRFELKDVSKKGKKAPEAPIVFDYLVYVSADPSNQTKPLKGQKEEEKKEGKADAGDGDQKNTPKQTLRAARENALKGYQKSP